MVSNAYFFLWKIDETIYFFYKKVVYSKLCDIIIMGGILWKSMA